MGSTIPRRLLGADNPEAWLRTVAVNLARSRWRRAQRLVGLAPRLVEAPRDADTDGHVVLLQALRKLPAGQREVIALHHLADLTVQQVADTLGLPTGTVKARLSRGRAALSTLLVDGGTPCLSSRPCARPSTLSPAVRRRRTSASSSDAPPAAAVDASPWSQPLPRW